MADVVYDLTPLLRAGFVVRYCQPSSSTIYGDDQCDASPPNAAGEIFDIRFRFVGSTRPDEFVDDNITLTASKEGSNSIEVPVKFRFIR